MMRFIEVRFDNSPNSGYRLSLNDSSLKIHYEFSEKRFFYNEIVCQTDLRKTFDLRDPSGLLGQSTLVQFWMTPSEIQIIRRGAQNCTTWVPHETWLQWLRIWKFQITMAKVTPPIENMVWYIPYILWSVIYFLHTELFTVTFYVTRLNSLKDSYQLISRTLIQISSIVSSKLEWNLNNVIVSSWLFSIKPLRYSVSSALDFHIRQVM